jgi:sulfite exporter TauE/SafE
MAADGIFVLMFVTGLTGGFGHCLGMCGPVVAAYSVALPRRSTLPHILYNLGRITTYSILGAAMGLTGSFVGIASGIQGLQKWAMVFAGAVIVLMGVSMAGVLPLVRYMENRFAFGSYLNKVRDIFSEGLSTGAFYPMGVLLGFIPCGLVYTALLAAARAGMEAPNHVEGLLTGLLVMLLFGLGTFPALLLFGKIVNVIGARLRARLYLVSSIVMIIAGLIFIFRALNA